MTTERVDPRTPTGFVPQHVDTSIVELPVGFIDAMSSAESTDDILRVAATWVPALIPLATSSVALVTADDTELELFALGGSAVLPLGLRLQIDGSLTGRAVRTRQTIVTPNILDETGTELGPLAADGVRSVLNVPIIGGSICFGTLNAAHSEEDFFTDPSVRLLSTIARLVGLQLRVHTQIASQTHAARTDVLTGLLNRRAILDHLAERLQDHEAAPPAILFIDLDGFKAVNDSHGHAAGDAMLVEMARRFEGVLRTEDALGRLGGDEFLVVCDEGVDGHRAMQIADRITEACVEPFGFGSFSISPGASIGVAAARSRSHTAAQLLNEADAAMYLAKRNRTGPVRADAHIEARTARIGAVDRELDAAMESGLISFHYQPVRHLTTGEILGAEALLRWDHPVHGMISPFEIIGRAEMTGRIEALTAWSLDTVCRTWASLSKEFPHFWEKAASFNLSPQQLSWRGYCDMHLETIERHGLRRHDVIVEVVESGTIDVGTAAEATLQQLGSEDVIIGLDDFGTGHHALGYFTRFPIHAIKFDRSLIMELPKSSSARSIVKGLAHIAAEIGITAVGEGIETQAEADICVELGLEQGQGFLLARPMPIDDLRALIRHETPQRP